MGWSNVPRADLDQLRLGLTATVRIGAIPTAVPVSSLMTEALCARRPRARIEVLSSRETVRRLAEFELDAGLTYLDTRRPRAPCHCGLQKALPAADRRRRGRVGALVGLVTADRRPASLVAGALLDAVRDLDVAAVLDCSLATLAARS